MNPAAIAAIIAGASALFRGISGAISGNKALDWAKEQQRKAQQYVRPTSIIKQANKLLPYFRAQAAATIGPQATGAMNAGLSAMGLTDSGLGAMLSAGAASAPGIYALSQAWDQAFQIQQMRAQVALSGKGLGGKVSPWAAGIGEGLGAGATAYLGAKQFPQKPNTATTSKVNTQGVLRNPGEDYREYPEA